MAATYEIVSQVPRTRSEPGGMFTQVIQVTFKTKPSGQVSMVDVPAQMFSVDEVDRLVAAAADTIERVQHL